MHAHRNSFFGQSGFNLVELIVVVAVLAIGATLGIPGFKSATDRYRAVSIMSELSASVAYSRSSAVGRGGFVTLCPGDVATGCRNDGDWSQGWIVFRSRNNASQPSQAEDVLRETRLNLPTHIKLVSTVGRTKLRFSAMGRSDGSNLTFTLCRDQQSMRQLVVNNAGRSRVASAANSTQCSK